MKKKNSSPHPAYVLNWVDLKDIGIDVMGEEAEAALGAATFRSNAPVNYFFKENMLASM